MRVRARACVCVCVEGVIKGRGYPVNKASHKRNVILMAMLVGYLCDLLEGVGGGVNEFSYENLQLCDFLGEVMSRT